jgi:CHASE1-domain containing sensor protein
VLFDISSSASRNITINAAIIADEMRATPRITLVCAPVIVITPILLLSLLPASHFQSTAAPQAGECPFVRHAHNPPHPKT